MEMRITDYMRHVIWFCVFGLSHKFIMLQNACETKRIRILGV